MRNSSSVKEQPNAWNPRATAAKDSSFSAVSETDPLLRVTTSYNTERQQQSTTIRERRKSGSNNNSNSASNHHFDMNASPPTVEDTFGGSSIQQSYNILEDDNGAPSRTTTGDAQSVNSSQSGGSRSVHQLRRHYVARGSGEHPPLLEIPEEVYTVRKSALTVLKPLTRTWVSCEVRWYRQ